MKRPTDCWREERWEGCSCVICMPIKYRASRPVCVCERARVSCVHVCARSRAVYPCQASPCIIHTRTRATPVPAVTDRLRPRTSARTQTPPRARTRTHRRFQWRVREQNVIHQAPCNKTHSLSVDGAGSACGGVVGVVGRGDTRQENIKVVLQSETIFHKAACLVPFVS